MTLSSLNHLEAVVHTPIGLTLTLGIGFILAITLGSIAWYNSKRPLGWKDKERPDLIPKVESDA
ncbi:photosystem II assembly protein Psb35 [Spirulina major]|uniref:photosystem II assembly protein Psb35 n=1 Tax=Spirulina major TaxID=270636 RepID=UPI0009325425|nr:hypothetical protein [Spirulina major]